MDVMAIVNLVVLVITIVVLGLAVVERDLLHSAILLGAGSATLAIIFFINTAPIAAVVELVVCAGLITVLFISAISLTRAGGD
jgi:NADH:ubiquinone oxidoreductase subunit 6 (subunit J)